MINDVIKKYKQLTPEMMAINDKIISSKGCCIGIKCSSLAGGVPVCPHDDDNMIGGYSILCDLNTTDEEILNGCLELKEAYESSQRVVEDINE